MNKSRLRAFLSKPMSGAEIERRSFEIIDAEAARNGFSPEQWEVVRRMIHTTGDLNIAAEVRFTPDAMSCGLAALSSGAPLYVDSKMIRAGLSIERLRRACPAYSPEKIFCHVSDESVLRESALNNLPRSLFAVRKAQDILRGGIAVFGNAPMALMELNRMIIEDGLRPALVIGMPVGFVHVTESKEELLALNAPAIVMTGRRGGSALAVSVMHALCTLAEDRKNF